MARSKTGDVVVNAAGAWAGEIRGLEEDRIHFYPVRGQILCFDARPGLVEPSLFSESGIVVPRRDGRILAGSIFEEAGFNKSVTLDGMERILRAVRAMVPSIASIPFREAWAGLRPASDDLLPVLGPSPTVANVMYAAGHFRSGILLSAVTGEVIADLVKGREPSIDLAAVFARPLPQRHGARGEARRHDMSNVIALGLIRDLFFRAKIDAVAAAVGAEVEYASSIEAAAARCAASPPSIIFTDLSDAAFPALDTLEKIRAVAPAARVIGFASHVDLKPLKAAREAGYELTLSRSEFTARLPELLKGPMR